MAKYLKYWWDHQQVVRGAVVQILFECDLVKSKVSVDDLAWLKFRTSESSDGDLDLEIVVYQCFERLYKAIWRSYIGIAQYMNVYLFQK